MSETKVWGSTTTLLSNPMVSFHRAEVKAGFRCSIHKHDHRHNGFFVEEGEIHVVLFDDRDPSRPAEKVRYTLNQGDFFSVEPGVYHRFECYRDSVLFELYWAASVQPDDITRLDVGGRIHG
jgi:mannose-6-phosphate isomerase-like protein (cupin superfamily)